MIISTQQQEILEDGEDLVKQIEGRGRICYKSEDKITKGSAKKFVKFAMDKKHNTVLEMAKITLTARLPNGAVAFTNELYSSLPKYITVDLQVNDKGEAMVLITATVRGFREWIMGNHRQAVANAVNAFLLGEEPLLFSGLPETTPCYPGISVERVVVGTDNLELFMRHTWVAVKFYTNRAVTHEIVRHRPVSYLQECVGADEEVQSFSGENKWPIEELYRLFNSPDCGVARKTLRVRVKNELNEIVPSQVTSVTQSGEKELFEVTTKNGRKIKTSEEHIFFAERGETRLKELNVGDRVWLNGKVIEFDWLYQEYLVKNRSRKSIATEVGMSDAWLGKVISNFGLQKPKSRYPNRKPGHGVIGMHSEEEKVRISKRMSGDKNHRWAGDDVKDGHSRCNAAYDLSDELCICGSPAVERHHTDRNSINNDPSNIELCCISCHKVRHLNGPKIAWLDEVTSISPKGVGMTYDLAVAHPAHNFVVGGFVVHNSQRYCRYDDEVVFIEPTAFNFSEEDQDSWETAMLSAEALYLQLLKNNSPQAARTVLPNSCKTEIIVYCNLVEWSHIFCQRTSPHAEPSMVESMVPVLGKFQKKFPGCFDKPQLSVG